MIFVTVGTHDQPFTRLMAALPLLPPEELVVQHGSAPAPADATRAVGLMAYDELQAHLAVARVVITHAGVGSVLSAIAAGHAPVVVPRLRSCGEHVDDHQLEFALALAKRGDVIPVLDVGRLPEAVASVPPRRAGEAVGEGPLHVALRQALVAPRRSSVRLAHAHITRRRRGAGSRYVGSH